MHLRRRSLLHGACCSACVAALKPRGAQAAEPFLPLCSAPMLPEGGAGPASVSPGQSNAPPLPPPIAPYAAADPRRAWKPKPGDKLVTLGVCFLNGDDATRDAVQSAAAGWFAAELGSYIMLKWGVEKDNSQIRILLDQAYNDCEIGTDANNHPDRYTMRLMNRKKLDDSALPFSYFVQHEFGHAFGLLHEQQHKSLVLTWDRDAIAAYLRANTQWSPAYIKSYIENFIVNRNPDESVCPAEKGNINLGSIMMYPIYRDWTAEHVAIYPGDKITARDRECVKSLYDGRKA